MDNPIYQYIKNLNTRYKTGISREHSYRGDLQNLLEQLVPDVTITNEPARIECGAPDYIITKNNIPIGYIEAKDIGNDLKSNVYKEQFDRYKNSLSNLILTNYLEFQLFRNGVFITSISIASIQRGKINPNTDQYESFIDLVKEFCSYIGQTITSASNLSKIMAGKARLLANIIEKVLYSDEDNGNTLKDQINAFKDILIHDITPKDFADIYAQTIAYGMFAARLHDPSLQDFSRQEASELIPKTNPFLRKLFQYIAGYDLDDRIKWLVDALADVFRATDVASLLKDFGKVTQQNDPMIHFYETFLSEYDPKLRKSRGVWYTPEPVVNFIVRAIDDILRTEFNLPQGLADTSKTKIEVNSTVKDNRSKTGFKRVKKEVHKVQILDPACGTGTFLAEVVKQIYKKFEGQQGVWSNYVENHLIPRLNGFEILMAPYAMAHLKLELLLRETGYKPKKEQRLNIYLTNSLEEHHPETGTLFANWLSTEANEANHIKRDTPVMVVLGNPPYSVSSTNKSEWIEKLIYDYKKDLNERNIQPLSDDYIKFIRYGQYLIEKNGEGILAFISNNSFIDGIIHRQMRKTLLEIFDKIYIFNLHGNLKKKESAPDGSKDQNVFDIMQGVSINIFVTSGKNKKTQLATVYNKDLYGLRGKKYTSLFTDKIATIKWDLVNTCEPYYFFVGKDFRLEKKFNTGIPVNKLFKIYNTGIETGRDSFFIDFENVNLKNRIKSVFGDLSNDSVLRKYNIKDNSNFRFKENLERSEYDSTKIVKILYRPFDIRYTYYDPTIQRRPSFEASRNLIFKNMALITCRQQSTYNFQHVFISNVITERCAVSLQTKETGYIFPLYIYPEKYDKKTNEVSNERTPNLNKFIVNQISERLGLKFISVNKKINSTFTSIDILDYLYAVLHSPKYREKYKEFLKIDFPRVPYPKDKKIFWKLVKLGGELRQIHLLESPKVERFITTYPVDGDNTVTRRMIKNDFEITNPQRGLGRVWINDIQYFDKVPVIAWEFYIGGYQPAQKWLKDRKGRELSFEDIQHYQKIIVALYETDRIMEEIDKIKFL